MAADRSRLLDSLDYTRDRLLL